MDFMSILILFILLAYFVGGFLPMFTGWIMDVVNNSYDKPTFTLPIMLTVSVCIGFVETFAFGLSMAALICEATYSLWTGASVRVVCSEHVG